MDTQTWPLVRLPVLMLLVLAGCRDLASIDADGQCGNGVLESESGEDCDLHAVAGTCGEPDSAGACRYVCTEGARCPDGFGCGLDGVCRAPSGQLERVQALPFPGGFLQAGDLDGDGQGDLVSFTNLEIIIAYGDPDGTFASRVELPAPPADTPPMVVRLNDDGRDDLVLPLPVGPQLILGQSGRTPLPVMVPSPLPVARPVRLVPVLAQAPFTVDEILTISPSRPHFSLVDRVLNAEAAEALLADVPLNLGESIPVARLRTDPLGPDTIALAPIGGDSIYLLQAICMPAAGPPGTPGGMRNGPCELAVVGTLPLPEAAQVQGAAFFADFDGDGHLDVIAGAQRAGAPELMVALGTPDGGFEPLTIEPGMGDVVGLPNSVFPPLRERALVAAVDLDADGRADFVTLQGAQVRLKGGEPGLRTALSRVRPWIHAVVADFNGDGRVDIAGAREQVVDLLVQTDRGTFNALQVPSSEARALQVGDFDGDLAPDLLILEPNGTVSVVFAGRQQVPSERVVMGQVDEADALVAALLADPDARTVEGIADAVLTGVNAVGDPILVRMRGTNARRLVGPIAAVGVPNATGVGDFLGDGRHWVVLKEDWPNPVSMMPPVPSFRLVSADDAVAGEVTSAGALSLGPECINERVLNKNYETVVDLDGDGRDEWLLMERRSPSYEGGPYAWRLRFLTFDPQMVHCHVLPSFESELVPSGRGHLVDLDLDGHLDVVVPISDEVTSTQGAGVAVWWGSATDFEAPMAYSTHGGLDSVVRIETLPLDEVPGDDLLLDSAEGLERLRWDAQRQMTEVPLVPNGVVAEDIQRIDADGDGVEDLAVGFENEVFIYRQVPCDARSAAEGQCARPH